MQAELADPHGYPGLASLSLSTFFLLKKIFIYLAVLGLSCGTQDRRSSLRRAGSLGVAFKLNCSMWDRVS